MYLSSVDPFELRCSNGSIALLTEDLLDAPTICHSEQWVGNSVLMTKNGPGYDSVLAGPPAKLAFGSPQPDLTHYVNNGRALPPIVVNLTDALGNFVIKGVMQVCLQAMSTLRRAPTCPLPTKVWGSCFDASLCLSTYKALAVYGDLILLEGAVAL